MVCFLCKVVLLQVAGCWIKGSYLNKVSTLPKVTSTLMAFGATLSPFQEFYLLLHSHRTRAWSLLLCKYLLLIISLKSSPPPLSTTLLMMVGDDNYGSNHSCVSSKYAQLLLCEAHKHKDKGNSEKVKEVVVQTSRYLMIIASHAIYIIPWKQNHT